MDGDRLARLNRTRAAELRVAGLGWPAILRELGLGGVAARLAEGLDVDAAARVGRRSLFREWARQLDAGHLNYPGIVQLRLRLATGEFDQADPEVQLMRGLVNDALAAHLGCEPADLPGADPVPDSPAALDGAGDAPNEDRRHRWG